MKYCKKCGVELDDDDNFCSLCGSPYEVNIKSPVLNIDKNTSAEIGLLSQKSKAKAFILCLCFGLIGMHNFYLGQKNEGILKLVLLCLSFLYFPIIILLLVTIIDLIKIASGAMVDSDGCKVKN